MLDSLAPEERTSICAVLENNPSVQKAALFGSRAKGSHSQYSDVDIALYGDVGILEVEKIICDLDELPYIYKFDVVAYNQIKNAALRDHIDRVGVVIYDKR